MTVSAKPEAVLSPLPKADGSATYSYAGYTITASANGPVEAQKRDEHPYEALVDVVVRPASGVGGQSSWHQEDPTRKHLLMSLTQVLGRGIWSRCCNSRCDSSSWSRTSLAASYRSSCR